jgi:hypothetical protein
MNETMKILEMIEKGTISPEEGAKLLASLEKETVTAEVYSSNTKMNASKKAMLMFKIFVRSADGDKINVQIPLEFAKIAMKTQNINAIVNNKKMNDLDIDLDWEMIEQLIHQGVTGKLVDIETKDGDIVLISIE